jgi:hypothetical protein
VNAGEQMYVKCSECKNAITLLMSMFRKRDIAFEGVCDTARCNRIMAAAEIVSSRYVMHMPANAISQMRNRKCVDISHTAGCID